MKTPKMIDIKQLRIPNINERVSVSVDELVDDVKSLPRWILTDGSNGQYGRSLGERKFDFKQGDEHMLIDLGQYTETQMEYEIESYYDTLECLKGIYGDQWEFIVAECIFENKMMPTF